MENFNENSSRVKEITKKYLPVTALILLTVILMLIFRYNKREIGSLIENGKNNLVSFYAQNLKPLFVTTDISDEDVFNFALYQTIPLDKAKNKVLSVADQGENKQVYEIKSSGYNPQTDNYKKFVEYLGLNSKQKEEADSILDSYKKEIYLSVLMNNKNTVAVSSKIGEIQKAVLANLVSFAQEVNEKRAKELFQSQYTYFDKTNINKFISAAREIPQKEYVFITPDTAFKSVCSIDTKDLEREIESRLKTTKNINTPHPPAVPSTNWDTEFHFSDENAQVNSDNGKEAGDMVHVFKPDSHFFKVVVPIPAIPAVPNISDSIKIHLDNTAKKLRNLSIAINNRTRKSLEREKDIVRDKSRTKSIEFYFQDPTEIVNKTLELLGNKNIKNWDEFGQQMDSMAQEFSKMYSDSILMKINKEKIESLKSMKRSKLKSPKQPKDSVENH